MSRSPIRSATMLILWSLFLAGMMILASWELKGTDAREWVQAVIMALWWGIIGYYAATAKGSCCCWWRKKKELAQPR